MHVELPNAKKPIHELAEETPASPRIPERDWLGSMAGTMEITGDVVSPVIEIEEIEALNH